MRQRDAIASLAATLVLVVGMGFGRFAFTGLYPLMVTSGQISVDGGSYAAAANYAGYLVGALLTALLARVSSHKLCLASVVATVVLVGLLPLTLPEWAIIAIRGLAGAASAISIVAATHWLIHDRDHHHGAPALFAGVGIGIVLSAELIAVGTSLGFSSFGIWAVLGLGALPLSIIAMALQARQERHVIPAPMRPQHRMGEASASIGPLRLVAVYGLAGFGYIITATYLPLLVRTAVSSIDPIHVWAIFGIGAVPSCFFLAQAEHPLGFQSQPDDQLGCPGHRRRCPRFTHRQPTCSAHCLWAAPSWAQSPLRCRQHAQSPSACASTCSP